MKVYVAYLMGLISLLIFYVTVSYAGMIGDCNGDCRNTTDPKSGCSVYNSRTGECVEWKTHYNLKLGNERKRSNSSNDWQYTPPANNGWQMPKPMNQEGFKYPSTPKPMSRRITQGETKEQYRRRVNKYYQNHGGGCFIESSKE